jgi:hypothetical protein
LQTEKGLATLQKTDIFRRLMWFSYEKDSNWYPIPCSQVVEIIEMNKRGEKPVSIVDMMTRDEVVTETTINNDLAQLDKRLSKKGGSSSSSKSKRNNRKRKSGRNRPPKDKGNNTTN